MLHIDLLEITASIGMATLLGITIAVPAYYYAITSGHGLSLWSILKVYHPSPLCQLHASSLVLCSVLELFCRNMIACLTESRVPSCLEETRGTALHTWPRKES